MYNIINKLHKLDKLNKLNKVSKINLTYYLEYGVYELDWNLVTVNEWCLFLLIKYIYEFQGIK